MTCKIIGCASALPNRVVTNHELVKFINHTSDEWITSRSGIKQRHISEEKDSTVSLAYNAAIAAIADSGIAIDQINMIIVCTNTSDHAFPSVANHVQSRLDIGNIPSFDMQVACSGFVYGMQVADSFLQYGDKYSNILLVCVDRMSSLLDFNDRTTGVLFGDGAGAVLLSNCNTSCADKVKATLDNNVSGIIDSDIYSDGKSGNILYTDYKNDVDNFHSAYKDNFDYGDNVIKMNGKEVFKKAIEKMSESTMSLLKKNNITLDKINYVIPHQANIRIINSVADKLDIDPEKIVITVEKHANCSAASIPLALHELKQNSKIKRGDLVIFTSFGAGITWGSILFRY